MGRAAKASEGVKVVDQRPAARGKPQADASALQARLGNRKVLALLQMQANAAASAGAPAGHGASARPDARPHARPTTQMIRQVADHGLKGPGQPLPFREQIQASFGHHDVGGIEAHTGGAAREANTALGAHGYTSGSSVAFAGTPSLHTAAHEAAHVVQQRAGVHLKDGFGQAGDAHERHADAVADRVVRGESAEHLLDQHAGGSGAGGDGGVQFNLTNTGGIGVAGMGTFSFDWRTINGTAAAPGAFMDGWHRFVPAVGAPNSNTIGFWNIFRVTVPTTGADVPVGTITPLARPHGALGRPGLTTDNNAATGVTGGFATDVFHHTATPGQPLSPRFPDEPTPVGGATGFGATPNASGTTGGVGPQTANGHTPGFKRSDDPSDIRSANMYDRPGFSGNGDFEFEAVCRGEDTGVTYGSINWGFGTRVPAAGGPASVINEHLAVVAGASATFNEAIERHRDFYVHEPVTIYFEFDRDNVQPAEDAKIAALAGYLGRNPAVRMTLDGFADQVGNATYNIGLSQRRVQSVRTAILGRFPAATVVVNSPPAGGGHGISTAATDATSEQPGGTADSPGAVAATGADQSREANRQFNRRVTITFDHPTGTGPTAPGGVAAPPAPAPAPAPATGP